VGNITFDPEQTVGLFGSRRSTDQIGAQLRRITRPFR
jgi:hypothetical protein